MPPAALPGAKLLKSLINRFVWNHHPMTAGKNESHCLKMGVPAAAWGTQTFEKMQVARRSLFYK